MYPLLQIWDTNVLAVACSFTLPVRIFSLGMSHVAAAHCLVAVGGGEPQVCICLCMPYDVGEEHDSALHPQSSNVFGPSDDHMDCSGEAV